jgi:hypothetical protein
LNLRGKELAGGWRRLRNEELHRFAKYYEGDEIKDDEMGGA